MTWFRHGGTSTYALHDPVMKWQTGWLRPNQRLLQTSNANDTVAVESDAAFNAAVEDLVVADAMANLDAVLEGILSSSTVSV